MKVIINAKLVSEALTKLLTVVDKKNLRPILTNCLVIAKGQKLVFLGTDLEISSKLVLDAEVEQEGSFCIGSKNLADIVRMLPERPVHLTLVDQMAHLKSGDIEYSLVTVNPEEFPKISFDIGKDCFRLKAKDILELIQKTSHAISTDETRPYLNGIFFQQIEESSNEFIRAVGIDGHRLAMLDLPEFLGNNLILKKGVIVPRKGIGEIKKLAESFPQKDISIGLDESSMTLNAENEYFLSLRLIARDYPNYKAVIPKKTTYTLEVDRNTFYDAVKRIRILSLEKTQGIKISFGPDQLILNANHPSLGKAVEKIPANYSGKEMEIGFNAKYLLDALSVHEDGPIVFDFNNELSPVVVKSLKNPHFLGIVMPLKL